MYAKKLLKDGADDGGQNSCQFCKYQVFFSPVQLVSSNISVSAEIFGTKIMSKCATNLKKQDRQNKLNLSKILIKDGANNGG